MFIHVQVGLWLSALLAGNAIGGEGVIRAEGRVERAAARIVQRGSKAVTELATIQIESDYADNVTCAKDKCARGKYVAPSTLVGTTATSSYVCPPLDVVFIMDTSGSMKDEAAALCASIDQILADLAAQDVVVNASLLGITETGDSTFACLTDDVVTLLGDAVPGDPDSCFFPNGVASYESWGPATAIVAERFFGDDPGNEEAVRIIIPLSDEGPCNGDLPDGCNDPGDDRDSIENAIAVASAHNVIVSPITGTGSNPCVIALANDVAAGTGGSAFNTQDAGLDLPNAIVNLLLEHCEDGGPMLCLEVAPGGLPVPSCHDPSDDVTVNVKLWPSAKVIVGGQFFFPYDPTLLEVVDVQPGQTVDANSPFSVEFFEIVDDVTGTIFYAVGIPLNASGTAGPAIMASVRFRPLDSCVTVGPMCLADNNPQVTRLIDEDGFNIDYIPCCSEEFTIAGGSPVLECPDSVAVNADPGAVTAWVPWGPVEATADCGGDVQVTCTATHSEGIDIDHLIETGGELPSGIAQFECAAADTCGLTASCSWTVQVDLANTLEVDVQLSPVIVSRALYRWIEFELYSNCVDNPVVVGQTLKFGPPLDAAGQAHDVLIRVPAGQYFCAAARDPLHTLRAASNLQIVDGMYTAKFRGDPAYGGNWLIGGNLNGDHAIDVLDFGLYLSQFGATVDPDTPCGTTSPHADINGDGAIDALDFSFIDANLGRGDVGHCCPGGAGSTAALPVTEVSLGELTELGLGHLRRADINGDGFLNELDVAAFLQGTRPAKSVRTLDRFRR